MTFLKCVCGHRILDISDGEPFKGDLYTAADMDTLWDEAVNEVTEVVTAYERGELARYWQQRFGLEPPNEPLAELVAIRVTQKLIEAKRYIYQCEVCGRLLVQSGPGRQVPYVSFVPEGEAQGVLSRDGVKGKQ